MTQDWLDRDTASHFAEYVSVVADRLGDRVKKWITLNEPAEQTLLGHALGAHAPGKTLLFDALPVAHHQLLAHGLAVRRCARPVPPTSGSPTPTARPGRRPRSRRTSRRRTSTTSS